MTQKQNWINLLLLGSLLIFGGKAAHAQITPDSTLGAERSRLTPNVPIGSTSGDRIDGGAQRGANLFHSFREFNVNNGQRLYFANPTGVDNILTRVTGGQVSKILGTLGVNGSANLFLLNPNGILFGPNAQLNVGGSFVGTTANAISFSEQGMFSATNPQAPSLLTVNPSALLFNQLNPGAIANQSQAPAGVAPEGFNTRGLRVPDGKSLLLVGGNVNLNGGRVRAYGGRIELAGLAAPGSIGLNVAGDTLSLNVPSDVLRADVSLTNLAGASVYGAGGGDIAINARDLKISSSGLFAGISIGLGNAGTQAGDITLNATEAITIAQTSVVDDSVYGEGNAGNIFIQAQDSVSLVDSSIFSYVEKGGVGNGGIININTGSLTVKNGAELNATVWGQGSGGNIIINARDRVAFDGKGEVISSRAINSLQPGGIGKAGDIQITTGTLSLTNRAFFSSSTSGKGDAGNIIIDARDAITLDSGGYAQSNVFDTGVGKGGNIQVTTGTLSLTNGAQISTNVSGQGDAGNITLNARDAVNLDGILDFAISGIQSGLLTNGVGKGGDIQITTGSLSVTNGASLSTSTDGRGNAGNITISARDTITFDGRGNDDGLPPSNASSTLGGNGVGNGGNIRVNARALFLKNGGQLNTSSFGQGDAGKISIDTRDTVSFDGVDSIGSSSGAYTLGDTGNGGDILVTTGTLLLTNGGQLSTFARGNSGNIIINARDITFDGVGSNRFSSGVNSLLLPNEGTAGRGGDIQITTNSLSVTNGAQLNASTGGQGNGGNITIDARDSIKFDGTGNNNNSSGAYSSVEFTGVGDAGNIKLTTGSLSLSNGGQLSASTFGQGNAGNIAIDARDNTFDGVGSNGNSSGIFSTVGQNGVGRAGNINIAADSLAVTNGGTISANTFGQGRAGDITIKAGDNIFLLGTSPDGQFRSVISTETDSTSNGDAGNITLDTERLSFSDGASILASTSGQGQAGNIVIHAGDFVSLSGVSPNGRFRSAISTETAKDSTGNAGNITLDTGRLDIRDGAGLFTTTAGIGRGGNIQITARDTLDVSGKATLANNQTVGTTISSATSGQGKAGDIFIRSGNGVTLQGGYISSSVDAGATADAGNIQLETNSLTLLDGGQIQASVFRPLNNLPAGRGNGGNINIIAATGIRIDGISQDGFSSGILTLTGREAVGRAGDITITTPDFQVANGGIVLASTFNDSRAGDVTINAQTFTATTGGQVVTNTLGVGDAGTIRLNVYDSITLSGSDPNFAARGARAQSYITRQEQGAFLTDVFLSQGAASGLFANTAAGSTGNGGSIIIDPRTFKIQDGARISVGSLGSGQGGSIQVQAGSLLLNRGQISAETASTNGGDITLQVDGTLWLRNGSLISTTAGTERSGGNGGNITINANNGFLIAFPSENSDISANAYSGNGGNVRINAQGIFGIQARPQLTPQSDITASSELGGIQGQVAIVQPDVQPTQGLVELPTDVLDASSQIAQVCPRGTATRPLGKFIVSGRGSLPPNPIEPLASTSNLSPLATLEGNSTASLPRDDRSSTSNNSLPVSPPAQIVEAQGWIKTPDGKIELVATVPGATPYAATTAAACP